MTYFSANAIFASAGTDCDPANIFSNLCFEMQGELKPIGDLLNSVPESEQKYMGRYYLTDLIKSTWLSSFLRQSLREKEMQVMLFLY